MERSYPAATRLIEQPRLERRLRPRLDPVGRGALAHGHDLGKLAAAEMDADAVVGRDPRRKSVRDELRVDGPAQLLPVVVRTGAAAAAEADDLPLRHEGPV